MTRALALRDAHTKVTAIVYTEHAKRFTGVLAGANQAFGKQLVEVSDFGPDTAMMMQSRIDAGELLVIVGDRVPPHDSGKRSTPVFSTRRPRSRRARTSSPMRSAVRSTCSSV